MPFSSHRANFGSLHPFLSARETELRILMASSSRLGASTVTFISCLRLLFHNKTRRKRAVNFFKSRCGSAYDAWRGTVLERLLQTLQGSGGAGRPAAGAGRCARVPAGCAARRGRGHSRAAQRPSSRRGPAGRAHGRRSGLASSEVAEGALRNVRCCSTAGTRSFGNWLEVNHEGQKPEKTGLSSGAKCNPRRH